MNWRDTGDLYRYTIGDEEYDDTELSVNLGGDWLISDRDYIAYNMELNYQPYNEGGMVSGCQESDGVYKALNVSYGSDDKYMTGNYNLFYRRTFASDRHLELTGRFGHYDVSPSNWYEETTEDSYYEEHIEMDNIRQTYSLEANYDFGCSDRFLFDVGTNTYHQQATIKDQGGSFHYKDTREYVYADMRNAGNHPFSYMLSLGMDVVSRDADGAKKSYVNILPAISMSYKFKDSGVLRLNLDRKRTSPTLSSLNPRNTSSDSLNVKVGNPYLRPEVSNNVTLSYTWNKGALFLQPSVSYSYLQDMVSQTGELEGNVYTSTYENLSHSHRIRLGLTGRVTLGEYGNVNINPFYQKLDMPGMSFSGNTLGLNGALSLLYKKISFFGSVQCQGYSYTRVSKTKSSVAIYLALTWILPKGWEVFGTIRKSFPQWETWIVDGSYSSYVRSYYGCRDWTPMIGITYTFRSKSKLKERVKKEIQNKEQDSFHIIKVQ